MAAMERSVEEIRSLIRSGGFEALFGGSPEGMFVFAADGRFVSANPALARKFGYAVDELESSSFGDVIHPDDRQTALAEFAASARGEVRQYVVTGVRRDGSTVRSRITQIPFEHEGETIAVLGLTADLATLESNIATDLEGARHTEARLAAVLGAISDGLLFLDRDYRTTYLNPRAEQILQVSAKDVLGRVIWELFPQALGSEFSIAYAEALREQRTVTTRNYSLALDAWLEATAYPTDDGLAIYFRDETASELAREEITRRDAVLAAQSAMLDNARDAIVVRGLDHRILFWNAAASRIYGWSHDEVIGRSKRELLYSDPAPFDLAQQATLRDGHWSGELIHVNRSGVELVVESSWTLMKGQRGQPDSIFSVNTDITEKRRGESRALRAQRMESLGTLASGIAHDLNNVLTPILMAVQLLAPGETDPRRREILQSTELAVKRGADMIRQVLSFASGATIRRVPVDLSELLGELEAICADTLRDNTSVTFQVDEQLWQTSGDATQLMQVLLNLVRNAQDAMPDGGLIEVRARNVTLTNDYSSVSHVADAGDYVSIEVEDAGSGIPQAILDKIFDPFFTTKPTGSGTGLGLSTSLAIIRGHDGFMQAYSEPGRGSVLRLHLPATTGHRDPAADTAVMVEELPRGDGELILVVDDEAAIRVLTRQTLDAYGYTTAVAGNGAEAIEYVESGISPVALVLTDMAMPVMDGAATAAYLLQNHPQIPVIVASGLNANGGVARARSSGVRDFLAKPYTTTELLRAVRASLHPQEGPDDVRSE
jgi:two-component system cell cycle sensor histidine kinase/response regulator CckA